MDRRACRIERFGEDRRESTSKPVRTEMSVEPFKAASAEHLRVGGVAEQSGQCGQEFGGIVRIAEQVACLLVDDDILGAVVETPDAGLRVIHRFEIDKPETLLLARDRKSTR